jgi:ribonuclease HI
LGLNSLKELKAKRIVVHVDSKLVINQVKGIYQTKNPMMMEYMNAILDLLEGFTKYDASLIPRGKNMISYALTTSASV